MSDDDAVAVAARGHLEHLAGPDLELLAGLARASGGAGDVRRDPARLLALLESPEAFEAVLAVPAGADDPVAPRAQEERFRVVSPFLALAVAVHRGCAEVGRTGLVPEWTGPRQRVPLFAGPQLRSLAGDPRVRLFLAELLASYARVASGSYRVQTRLGPRRRRWNDLDPVRLVGLLDAVPEAEQAGVYRRLGDLALFLTGVFPDHTALHALGPVDAARLLRASGVDPGRHAGAPAVELLARLGRRWYGQASARAVARTGSLDLVEQVAAGFDDARRVLTLVADRYLFPQAVPWLPSPGG